MLRVVRWGRSAYERGEDLLRERASAEALGGTWTLVEDRTAPPVALRDADVLVVNSRVRVDARALDVFGGRLVVTTTSGHDHVDVAACAARGVVVARCPEARRDAVVEHALGALVALMRRMPALEEAARGGHWARGELPALAPRGLAGATVVVVGLGVIGKRVAALLDALGAGVRGVDPAVPGTPTLDEALDGADAVTLHCSLTPGSRGLLGAARLDRLPPHAVVVNTARGDVLDVEAAVERVRAGRLRGVACDVFPVEPYPGLAAAAAVPGVIFTPHAAGFTHDLGARVAAEVDRTLRAWVRGEPLPHPVTTP